MALRATPSARAAAAHYAALLEQAADTALGPVLRRVGLPPTADLIERALKHMDGEDFGPKAVTAAVMAARDRSGGPSRDIASWNGQSASCSRRASPSSSTGAVKIAAASSGTASWAPE